MLVVNSTEESSRTVQKNICL